MLPLLFFFLLPCTAYSHSSPSYYSDRLALLSFKHSLSISTDHDSLHDWSPNLNTNACNWTGVTCSHRRHRVVSLNLTGDDMTPYIADFGIAKLLFGNSVDSLISTNALKGSIGYIAPEYGVGGRLSTKGDVYSFGILLLELLTRRRPTDDMFIEGMNLPKWVGMDFPNKIIEVVDENLLRDANESEISMVLPCLTQFMQVGLICTREMPQQRPDMTEIVERLEYIKGAFHGTPRAFQFPINILPLLVEKSRNRNTNRGSNESWSTSTS